VVYYIVPEKGVVMQDDGISSTPT